jgi:hypothetical protein
MAAQNLFVVKKHLQETILLVLVIYAAAQNINAQPADSLNLQSQKPASLPKNALNINPLSVVFGSFGGTYEHLFGDKHGVFIEGSISFNGGGGFTIGYRRHIGENKGSLNSAYWGPFVSWRSTIIDIKDSDTDEKYDLDFELLIIGINRGARHHLKGPFNYAWRVGYGFPVYSDFSWSPRRYDEYKTIEAVTKILGGIDAELSIGIEF